MHRFYTIGGLLRNADPATGAAGAAAAAASAAATTTPAAGTTTAPAAGTPAAASTSGDPASGQAAAGTAAATAATAGAAPAQPVVPEKYELALPQGSPLDQSDVDAVTAMAKAGKWTQEQATAALAEMHDHTVKTSTQLLSTLNAHPEVGGANLEAAQANANRALDRFLPATQPEGAELRSALKKSGYSNYAPLVVLLARIGKAMGEDRSISDAAGGAPVSREAKDVLYGGPPVK